MRAIKIAVAALLVAAAVLSPGIGDDREHILGADVEVKREHIL